MRLIPSATLATVLALAVACSRGSSPTYTLYRSDAVGDANRIHVATFDARDDEASYNHDTCEHARELFQVQPSNRARYWCEAGRYHAK